MNNLFFDFILFIVNSVQWIKNFFNRKCFYYSIICEISFKLYICINIGCLWNTTFEKWFLYYKYQKYCLNI